MLRAAFGGAGTAAPVMLMLLLRVCGNQTKRTEHPMSLAPPLWASSQSHLKFRALRQQKKWSSSEPAAASWSMQEQSQPNSSLPQKIQVWAKTHSVIHPSATTDKQGSGPTWTGLEPDSDLNMGCKVLVTCV